MPYEKEGLTLNEFTKPSSDAKFEEFKKVWFAEFAENSTDAADDSSDTSVCNSSPCSDARPCSESDGTLMIPSTPPPSSLVMANGRPNFSGTWLCHTVRGDIDALMVDLQVDWTRRTAAACFGYGVNFSKRIIEHHGNQMVIHINMSPGYTCKTTLEIGGGEQQTNGPEGPVVLFPQWEHGHMLSVVQNDLDGSLPSMWQQYFLGEDLVVKLIATSGISGCWQFGRV